MDKMVDPTGFYRGLNLPVTTTAVSKPPKNMRVVFIVRCHGEPDENVEQMLMDSISDVVDEPQIGWGILTIGRQYYHDDPLCEGHADALDECERLG